MRQADECSERRVPENLGKERDEILSIGFNPPKDRSAEQFRKEIRQICDRLQGRLSESWRYGIGDGDFFIHTSSEEDRMLCVEISSAEIVNDKLLDIAHCAITDIATDYCVDFCNNWFRLKLISGEPYPDFNIFVSRSSIQIYTEWSGLLQQLGIDGGVGS